MGRARRSKGMVRRIVQDESAFLGSFPRRTVAFLEGLWREVARRSGLLAAVVVHGVVVMMMMVVTIVIVSMVV